MLRNVPARSRSFRATLFGRSAVPKRRRRSRSKRPPIGAEQLESRAMLAGVDINGGLSWNGWTNRGLSNQAGLYGSGGMADTELYEVYTTAFAFDATSNTITDNPVQAVAPAPTGFETGRTVPTPFGPLVVSAGAFQAGNTILGIGVRATGTGSITSFKPTLRFDLDNDSYAPASATGGTVGRTSFSSFSEQGDFTVQFEGASSWRGSTISVQAGSRTGQAATYTGTNNTVLLPGGVGSGTSYDFAFRAFAQPAATSYQMFLDMTLCEWNKHIYNNNKRPISNLFDYNKTSDYVLSRIGSDNYHNETLNQKIVSNAKSNNVFAWFDFCGNPSKYC